MNTEVGFWLSSVLSSSGFCLSLKRGRGVELYSGFAHGQGKGREKAIKLLFDGFLSLVKAEFCEVREGRNICRGVEFLFGGGDCAGVWIFFILVGFVCFCLMF